MLIRHSSIYLLARGIPALFNFAAIAVYTHWLSADAYGTYMLALSIAGLVTSTLFGWLGVGVFRFLPEHRESPTRLLSSVLVGFLGLLLIALVSGFIGGALFWRESGALVSITVALLIANAWYEMNLGIVQSRLAPVRYGLMSVARAALSLAIGAVLILMGSDAHAPLLGLIAGALVASLLFARGEWRGVTLKPDRALLGQVLSYGLPLTAGFTLAFITSSSDRLMLAWYLGNDAVGLYTAGYDFTNNTVGVVMSVVNLAAHPIALRMLKEGGTEAARKQLGKNLTLLLAVALPTSVGISICGSTLANLFLGAEFRASAQSLIPWIAIASVVWGMKVFYLDLAFHFSKQTRRLVGVMVVAAVVNLALNFFWIPRFGILGAAYATVVAYLVAFLLSWMVGRRLFPLARPSAEHGKIVLAALVMGLGLWLVRDLQGMSGLLIQMVVAGVVYAACLLAMNVESCRVRLAECIHSRRAGRASQLDG